MVEEKLGKQSLASLFFQDKLYHANNKSLRDFAIKLEKIARKAKADFV